MCSLKVAFFTDVLLQVKSFVLYQQRYDHEVHSGKVQTFKALSKRSLKLFNFAFIPTLHEPIQRQSNKRGRRTRKLE